HRSRSWSRPRHDRRRSRAACRARTRAGVSRRRRASATNLTCRAARSVYRGCQLVNPGRAVKHAAFARGVTVHQSSGVTSLLLAQVGQSATATSNALIAPGPFAAATTAERWAELVAVLLLIGVVIFRLAILPGARWSGGLAIEAADRARRLGVAALVLFL